MDIIIVCHTEFGFVTGREVLFEKNVMGVKKGVANLIKIANKYDAKITFAACPETVNFFPKEVNHEIGLHIHPGWRKFRYKNWNWYVGDSYLKDYCKQSANSIALSDYSYEEQLNLIKTGKEYLKWKLGVEPNVFVAGKWSENNGTIRALIEAGFTHDCTAIPRSRSSYYDWSKLPRICMPYHPSEQDYQKRGSLPLLIVPISRMLLGGSVNPEIVPIWGLSLLEAGFLEYYWQNLPLFHICLHSPCMTDSYFISIMDKYLSFISGHKNVSFKFASEIREYEDVNPKADILPYLLRANRSIINYFMKIKTFKV